MIVARRAAALVLAVGALAGCGSAPSAWTETIDAPPSAGDMGLWRRQPTSSIAGDLFAQAKRMRGLGRTVDAVEAAVAAIEADPAFIESHRLLQDLLARTTADWWLKERYEALLRERPGDADAWYLLGRIETDSDRQFELFSGAVARDRRHPYAALGRAVALARRGDSSAAIAETRRSADLAPWLSLPWLWLGGESMKRGDPATAARFYEAARDRDREDPRAWLGIAEAADDLARADVAGRSALQALQLAPGDEAIAATATEVLARTGGPAELAAALDALAAAEADGASAAVCSILRGRLLLASGRPADAGASFDAAIANGASAEAIAGPLRLARVLSGRFKDGVLAALETLPREAFSTDDAYAPRWKRLATASAADLSEAHALLELGEAMASVGWLQESRTVLAAAAAKAPEDAAIAARVASETTFGEFVADLGRIARESRNAVRDDAAKPGVRDILSRISHASRRRFGRDVVSGATVRSYPFLGEFAVSAASSGAFETTFGSHGLMCLVGARDGAAAELVVGRMVVVRGGVEEIVLGSKISFDECWIESEGLPTDVAGLRRGLAGLTLDRFVLLQLDSVRRGPRPASPDLPFVARPARTREELRALDSPSDVAGRIEADLAASGRLRAGALDAVRRHELVHVHDAANLLPVSSHPFSAFAFGLSHGFSGAKIERALEGRAQAFSILSAREPRLALSALLAFLPSREGDTPHVAGYCDVVQTAVDLVVDDLAAFPSIDPAFNVVQQMDKLTDAEVRELARRLAEEL